MKSYISLLFSVLFVAFAVLSCNQAETEVLVTDISINQASAEIVIGETLQLNATVTPSNASRTEVNWASSAPSVAKVSNQGLVTALAEGSAVISATVGGKTGVCTVTVKSNITPSVTVGAEHISSISVILKGKANLGNTSSSNLMVGFQYSKSSGILPSNSITVEAKDADSEYNYSVSITGLEPGTTYYYRSFVREKGQDTYGDTKEFKTKDLSSMLQTKEATSLSAVSAKLNGTLELTDVQCQKHTVGFYYGSNSGSLNEKVTIGSDSGEVSSFISKLTPSSKYFYQAFVLLDDKEFKGEVLSLSTKDVSSLIQTYNVTDLAVKSANLNAILDLTDAKYSSIAYGFYWGSNSSSLDSNIKGGEISNNSFSASLTGLNDKTQYWYKAYVTLDNQTFNGEVKSFTTDAVSVQSVSLDKDSYTFNNIGKTITLHATVLPTNATDKSVTWSSDKTSVATVDENGVVTSKGIGTATITVKTNDGGKSATCAITVAQLITDITISPESIDLYEGESYTLTATITPTDATNKTLTWRSWGESVAKVDNNGKVTAISKGSTTIAADANDGSGKTGYCKVNVIRKVSSITLSRTSIKMYKGQQARLWAYVFPIDASYTDVTWESTNTSILTVTDKGVIKAKAIGSANIKAISKDGKGLYVICQVTVVDNINVPTAVDLGLKVKWASCNVGAFSEEDYGDYYAWGETTTRYGTDYGWNYNTSAGIDGNNILKLSSDAAHIPYGTGCTWRMPTKEDWQELKEKCTWEWTTLNGVYGYKVTTNNTSPGYAGKWIFLPAAGYMSDYEPNYGAMTVQGPTYSYMGGYWSSSLNAEHPTCAWHLYITPTSYTISYSGRNWGYSVRAVTK